MKFKEDDTVYLIKYALTSGIEKGVVKRTFDKYRYAYFVCFENDRGSYEEKHLCGTEEEAVLVRSEMAKKALVKSKATYEKKVTKLEGFIL